MDKKDKILTKKALGDSSKIASLKASYAEDPQAKKKTYDAEALLIVYPDYKIDTEIDYVGKIGGLGHAGVLLISQSGNTRYYEYGRYPTTDGTRGIVRKVTVPNAYIGSNGLATDDSLIRILATLSSKSGQNGKIEAAYFKNLNFEDMDSFAMTKLKESNTEYKEY